MKSELNLSCLRSQFLISAAIGSFNLDPLSWDYNTETKIVAYDPNIANRLTQQFNSDKQFARRVRSLTQTWPDLA